MPITLYGSLPSPYVRRIRMLLENVEYKFEEVDVYNDAGRAKFEAITPIKKLPVLVDGNSTIFDSHVISQHLCKKKEIAELTIEQSNIVSVIDAVTDSLIVLFLGKRSELPVSKEKLLFKLQLERVPSSLAWLEAQAGKGVFEEWGLGVIALISLLDWAEYRELYCFSAFPFLLAAKQQHAQRDIVCTTAPNV